LTIWQQMKVRRIRHRRLPNELLQRLDAQRREVIVAERLDHDALHQRGSISQSA
jgi:hypothetical protein